MFSFHLLSDIHLELLNNEVDITILLPEEDADFLFIAGDLGNPFQTEYKMLLSIASKKYQKVFLITGNHEYYNGLKMDMVEFHIKDLCTSFDNVFFLQKEVHELELENNKKLVILGCTLWSHLLPKNRHLVVRYLNDFKRIHDFETCSNYNTIFNDHRKWLQEQFIKYKDDQIIVLTHHMPSHKLIAKKFIGNPLNDAFATNLEYLMDENRNIKWWLCGHSHQSNRALIFGTDCMLNPYGYKGEETLFTQETFYT